MSSLFRLRTVLSLLGVAALASPACVIKLSDENSPEVNGAVTGAPADCSQIQALGGGAPGGAAEIKYIGRFSFPQADPDDPTAPPPAPNPEFDWSGNNITVRFQGTSQVTAKLFLPGEVPQDMMFEFEVDGKKASTRHITVTNDANNKPTNTPLVNYDVDVTTDIHELRIWKNTEAQKGTIIFQGFDLHGGTMLPPTRRPRQIEVIGDSIICGYGDEGQNATCPFEIPVRNTVTPDNKTVEIDLPVTENQYLSFTSLVGRMLDADVQTYCWSGKGVYLNYKEDLKLDPTGALVLAPDATTTVPQLWEKRTIANDVEVSIPWDFTKEKPELVPQVVFVSLGTNDFSRDTLPQHPNDPNALPGDNIPDGDMNDPAQYEKFYETYLDFVNQIRTNRPNAHIFLATPPMLTDQFPLQNSRTRLRAVLDRIVAARAAQGDAKVYAMNLVEMGFRYGLGCDYHPNLEVHTIMAQQLAGAIKSKTCWN